MAETLVERRSVHLGTPVLAGPARLLPLVAVVLRVRRTGAVWHCTANQELHALVVRDAQGLRAFDLAGTPLALPALRAQVAGLDAALAGF